MKAPLHITFAVILLGSGALTTHAADSRAVENKVRRIESGTRPSVEFRREPLALMKARAVEVAPAPGWAWENSFALGGGFTTNADSVPDGQEAWFGSGKLVLGAKRADLWPPLAVEAGYTGTGKFFERVAASNDEVVHKFVASLKGATKPANDTQPAREWAAAVSNTHVVIENDSIINVAAASFDLNTTLPAISKHVVAGLTSAHQWRAPRGTPAPRRDNHASRIVETAYLGANFAEWKDDAKLPVVEASYARSWHLARGAEQDFDGWEIGASVAWTLSEAGRALKFEAAHGRENGNNRVGAIAFRDARHDRVTGLTATYTHPVAKAAKLKAVADYGRTKSNLPDASYRAWTYSLHFTSAF